MLYGSVSHSSSVTGAGAGVVDDDDFGDERATLVQKELEIVASREKRELRQTIIRVLSVIFLIVVSCVIFFVTFREQLLFPLFEGDDAVGADDVEYVDDAVYVDVSTSESQTKSSFRFTLLRDGYDVPLPYFMEDYNTTYFSYRILDQYDGVMEPYADMYLASKATSDFSFHTFKYNVSLVDSNSGDTHTDDLIAEGIYSFSKSAILVPFSNSCRPYEVYTITVDEHNIADQIISTTSGTFICLFVRREMQSLSVNDFAQAMDAMHTLWATDDESGQALYGDKYHSASYLASAHDFNAAQVDADHIYKGLGFLPQHIKLANLFETSVQTVDASFSLPYWDWTKEAAGGLTVQDSIMFSNSSFGTLGSPGNSYWGFTYESNDIADGRIMDGRWKDTLADWGISNPSTASAFGYVRGPWNTNPSPYISRFSNGQSSLPSCGSLFDFWGNSSSSSSSFLGSIESSMYSVFPRGVGSVFGCDMLDDLRLNGLIASSDDQLTLCQEWGSVIKALYRSNYIYPTEQGCTWTSEGNDDNIVCSYTCADEKYDDLLEALSIVIGPYATPDSGSAEWSSWRDFLCKGDAYRIFPGDLLESASPADPAYWPIHPNLERLLHAQYMGGGFDEDRWPSDYVTEYVCDQAECYEDGTYGSNPLCCQGHFDSDQLLDFINLDRSGGYGDTNQQTIDATNPASAAYSMPYIYDDVTWQHCLDQGYDINSIIRL
jgi:Common central domain of tyrosinase